MLYGTFKRYQQINMINKVHPNFRLNGKRFTSKDDLLNFTKEKSEEAYQFLVDWFNDKDHIIVYTSGSTGAPKPIKIKKKFMVNSAMTTANYFELQEEGITALLCLSPNYIAGKMMLVRALISGWDLDVVPPSSTPLQNDKEYDFAAMVPMQVHHSLKDLHKVKLIIVGGGAVSKPLEKRLQKVTTEVFATYSMTETVTHIAVKKLNHLKGITNYFEVLPYITVEKDDRGCLVIDAPNLSDNKIVTNDIVKMIDNRHFCWLGRFDNIINSGGFKIVPEQVEEKLSDTIKKRFFIASEKDEILGEKVILVIEGLQPKKEVGRPKAKSKPLNFDFLDKYEKPKTVYYLKKFVETKTNKINRKACLNLIFD